METLLRKTDVEVALRISRSTVERLLATGELPVVRVGRRGVRIPARAVEDLIERGSTPRRRGERG